MSTADRKDGSDIYREGGAAALAAGLAGAKPLVAIPGGNGITTVTTGIEVLPTIRVGAIPDPGPPKWLVDQLWTAGAFGIVGAEPKAWKSWVTLYFAVCIAAGLKVFGRWDVIQGGVVVFSAEGGKGLVRHRATALCRALDIDITTLPIDVIDVPVLRLDDTRTASRVILTTQTLKPVLLLLDPLRELYTGDENDAAAIAELLGPLRTLQDTVGCAVMLVHHMRKAGVADGKKRSRGGQQLRGSSALHGAVDSALYLEKNGREGRDKRITVSAEHRSALEPTPFQLQLRVLETPDGQAIWPEIVEEETEEEQLEQEVTIRDAVAKKVIAAIQKASMPGRTPFYAMKGVAKACKMRPETCAEAIRELLAGGVLVKLPGKLGAILPADHPAAVAHLQAPQEASDG